MIKVFCHASELGVAQQILSIKNLLNHEVYSFSAEVFDAASQILTSHGTIKDSDISICGFDSIANNKTSLFIEKTRKHKIKSIGILDTWKGIDRFFFDDGSKRDLTDLILVFDEYSKTYLMGKGIPENKLEVSSDFFLEELLLSYEYKNENLIEKENLLNSLKVDREKPNMFFFSEPITNKYGSYVSLFDQSTIDGSKTIGEFLYETFKDEYNLFLRRHPTELITVNQWIDANNLSLSDIFFIADKVAGLSSTPIYYASQLGIEVYNLEENLPNWKPEFSQLPNKVWKHIKHLYNGKIAINRVKSDFNYMDKLINKLI